MGIQRDETSIHWNYFLAIEDDLERLSRYVDFSKNDDTYSIEIARIFLSSCSEIDVILKQICKALNPDSNASSINQYFLEISAVYPEICEFEVLLPKHELTLTPLSLWSRDNPPYWWQCHNKVKHHRHQYFEQANLKNCLNAVAAMYIFTLYLYADKAENGELLQYPKLLSVGDRYFAGTQMGRWGVTMKYNLRNEKSILT